ncbi:MAG: hypothetical protein Q8P72_02215, partial [Candidatus Roizmanbacteria bacterium]|nr:hypothetical protein [Candidatus Roizmanbacteria bacterium]
MNVKVIIGIIIIAIIAIIIGLVVLLQKQTKSEMSKKAEVKGLEIVGANGATQERAMQQQDAPQYEP